MHSHRVGQPFKNRGGKAECDGLDRHCIDAISQWYPNVPFVCRRCRECSYYTGRQSRIRSHDARGCVRVNYFINYDYALLNPKPHKALNPESFNRPHLRTLHPPTLSPKTLQPGEDISVKQLERHSVEVRPTSCLDSSGPRRLIPG